MRGIGKGQTVVLLTPPEVAQLIKMELVVGRASENQQNLRCGCYEQDLNDVVAWLLINGIKSEQIQANMLICQNVANVWKKRAYRDLMRMGDEDLLAAGGKSGHLSLLLTAWREETDSGVPNSIPLSSSLRHTIDRRVSDMKRIGLLKEAEDSNLIKMIIKLEFGEQNKESAIADDVAQGDLGDGNVLLEGEQVQEQEQEQVTLSCAMHKPLFKITI